MSILHTDEEFHQLKNTKELYRQIFNCSVLPIIIHDMHLNILDVNDKAVSEFGYSREEFLKLQVLDLHTPCEFERSLDVLEEIGKTEIQTVKTKFQRKDGTVFLATASPCKIELKRNSFIHVHLQDIKDVLKESEA